MAKTEKVWNVTDDPSTDHAGRTIMVMGRNLPPGRFMRVDAERLKKSKKVQKDVAAKLLFIGNDLPAEYLKAMKPVRTGLPIGANHGHKPMVEAKEEAVAEAKEPVEMPENMPEPTEETTTESSEEETSEDEHGGRRRRRRG